MTKNRTIPETPPDYDRTRITERPDGYYWREKGGKREYGPFETLLEAVEDMDYNADAGFEPGETLEQAEEELGLATWVDPETGELAEEERPRLEDH
jgi:hypothetical protein